MGKLTYNTKLIFDNDSEKEKIIEILNIEKFAYNECSKVRFNEVKRNSIVELHNLFYHKFRESQPQIPSQIIIRAEQEVLSNYRSIKSNKHKIHKPVEKKNLSLRLDKRIYSFKNDTFSIVSLQKRVKCKPYFYPKLKELFEKYRFCDPLIFFRDNEVWIALTFDIPETLPKKKLAVGIDLGICNFAATSEGNLYQDKEFNKRKRQLRFNKRKLQSKSKTSKSAKRKLKKLRRKERNINKNFLHHLANKIIQDTKADVLVLEDLKSIKLKKHKYQNKNKISQISLFELREILTYKAALCLEPKTVMVVSPAYTSQIDNRTGKKDGIRIGGRYIGKDGQILSADCNAACNIALRSKLPCSILNYYAWQAKVTSPIVGCSNLQALEFIRG